MFKHSNLNIELNQAFNITTGSKCSTLMEDLSYLMRLKDRAVKHHLTSNR